MLRRVFNRSPDSSFAKKTYKTDTTDDSPATMVDLRAVSGRLNSDASLLLDELDHESADGAKVLAGEPGEQLVPAEGHEREGLRLENLS